MRMHAFPEICSRLSLTFGLQMHHSDGTPKARVFEMQPVTVPRDHQGGAAEQGDMCAWLCVMPLPCTSCMPFDDSDFYTTTTLLDASRYLMGATAKFGKLYI